MLAAPRIEEGHNVFIVDGRAGRSKPDCRLRPFFSCARSSTPATRRSAAAIRAPTAAGAARAFRDRPFAFSADGIFDHPAFSRRVTGIDFVDPVWLRLGFINELRYNWNSNVSDLDAGVARPPRFWVLVHRWKLEMPWFVMYRFPAELVGSALCWRGDVLWEGAGGDSRRSIIARWPARR
jgi:hypothetical protein